MSYFRAIISVNEHSHRAFSLTGEVVSICPGNYTGWYYRGLLIDHLNIDLKVEKTFLSAISTKNPKNYQIWSYRRELLKKINDPEGEIDFVNSILEIDAKNIHAWGYRQWLIKKFSLWPEEIAFVNKLLALDPYNNSAWNQRRFILVHSESFNTLANKVEEINFAMNYCRDIENECPYSYLRIFYSPEVDGIVKEKIGDIAERCGVSRHLLQFLAYVYEKQGKGEIQVIVYNLLIQMDFIRESYWTWKKRTVKTDDMTRTSEDRRLCKIINSKLKDDNAMFTYYYQKSQLISNN